MNDGERQRCNTLGRPGKSKAPRLRPKHRLHAEVPRRPPLGWPHKAIAAPACRLWLARIGVAFDDAPKGRYYRGKLVVREINCRHELVAHNVHQKRAERRHVKGMMPRLLVANGDQAVISIACIPLKHVDRLPYRASPQGRLP